MSGGHPSTASCDDRAALGAILTSTAPRWVRHAHDHIDRTPAQTEARVDIRFNDCHTRVWLESRLRRLAAGQLHEAYELELRCSAELFVCAPGPWHEAIVRAAREVTGRPPEFSTSGGSDARFIHPYCPAVELGLVGASMHCADEHVSLADLDSHPRFNSFLTPVHQSSGVAA